MNKDYQKILEEETKDYGTCPNCHVPYNDKMYCECPPKSCGCRWYQGCDVCTPGAWAYGCVSYY